MTAEAWAAAKTWNGSVSTAWGDTNNWNGGLPGSADDTTIPTSPAGGRFPTISSGTYSVKAFIIQASATVTQTGGTLQVYDEWRNSGTYNATSGTVQFSGNGGGGTTFASSTNQFYHLIIDAAIDPKCDDAPGSAILIAGDFTNYNTALDNDLDWTGTLNGSGNQAIYSASTSDRSTFGYLVVDKSGGTATLTSTVNVKKDATITNGTFDIGSQSFIRDANGGTLAVQNSATFKIGGTNSMPTSFTTRTFNSTSTVEYSGTTQSVSVESYGNLTISGSGTATLAGNITPAGNLTVSSGTLNLGSYTANRSSAGGTLTVSSGATLQIGGTNTLPSNYSTHSIGATSTITYSGTNQTVSALNSSQDYGHLTLSGSGTKTLGGTQTVRGTLTLSGASLADGGYTLSANGDISNATSHTGSGKIALTGGSAAHTLSGGGSYTNLQMNDAYGATLSSNATVNGTLTLSSGNITTGANTLSISSSGTVSRTSGHIVGNLQKHVATGATSRTFEIGDAGNSTPVNVSFASVSVAGNLTASTTAGEHPNNGLSPVDPNKNVNRYWTLTNSGITFTNYSSTFNFVSGDVDAGANTSSFLVGEYTGGAWSSPTVGTKSSTSTQATGLTGFGDFQAGELNPASTVSGAAVTSLTWAHTVSNFSNRTLVVGVQSELASNVQPSGITYNGAALTQIGATYAVSTASYQNVSLWYLIAPAVGTYNVVVTWGVTIQDATAGALSIYGYAQVAPEASNTSFNNAGAATTTLTTLTNNALVVDMFGSGQAQGDLAPGSGQTQRFINSSSSTTSGGASTKVVASPGLTSMTWSQTGINRSASVAASFALAYALSGNVFEDVNYGGGAGRTKAASSGVARSSARVELYNIAGAYSTYATTDSSGNYSFAGIPQATYYVRVVNSSVTSSRTGYTTSCLAVMTYRTTASSGSAVSVTDYAGGTDPAAADPGNGSGGTAFNTSTFVFTAGLSGTAQAVTQATIVGADITGMDFGFNFDTIVNINGTGQGSLRQFITSANLLSNTGLTQSGRTAGIENALWMISNGTAAAGLRATNNYFSGGVATIVPTSGLPALTDPGVLDAQTQPGWSSAPVIELNGASSSGAVGIGLSAAGCTVRGLVINRFFDGVYVYGAGDNAVIQGNYIGTSAEGTTDLGNTRIGVITATGADSITVGGTSAATRNVISGNNQDGVNIQGGTGYQVLGNYIGLNAAGTAAIANSSNGIYIYSGVSNAVIGGTATGAGNIISGNGSYGISDNGSSTTIQGNYIGTNAAGTAAVANTTYGVRINTGATGAIVGGTAANAGNVISGNTNGGISTSGGTTTLQGNKIGTNTAGTAALANGNYGVQVASGTSGVTIGGTSAAARNIISGNSGYGITTDGSGTVIQGNYIGLNAAGTAAVANTSYGVLIGVSATSATVGGTAAGAVNVISGNSSYGLVLSSSGHTVQGNKVGTNAAGDAGIANSNSGIYISGANNSIGGAAAGAGNLIAYNSQAGITISGATATGNLVSRNSVYSNGGIGIDLAANGVTVNDGAKTGSQPNLLMDYAIFTSASLNGTSLAVAGYVGSAASQPTFAGATVEIFKSDSDATGYGEGQTWLGTLTADANGNFSGTISVSGINPGDKLTGTATDGSNNSSEFGINFSITAIFYSKSSSAVDTASNWNTARNGTGTDAASFFPNCTWVVQNTHSMTLSSSNNWNVQATGTAQIESGGTWTNSSSGTVTIGTFQIDNGGTYSHSTTAAFPGTTRTFGATSTVNYSASADQSVTALTYGHLIISGSGTKTLAGSASVQGDLTLQAGTLDLSTYTANRSAAGGTLSIYNGATLKIGGTNGFPSNYSSLALGATSTVNYAGSTQSVAGITYGHLAVSAAGTKTLAGNASIQSDLAITAGTLDLTSYTANRSSAGGTLSISNGAMLKIGSTNGFPSNYSSLVLGATSTVDYYGTNQPVSAITYGHLNLSTSGIKTFAAGTTYILGDLAVSGSAAGNGTTNSTTINFSGTGAQAVASIAYHHLTLSTSGTKTLSAAGVTVAGNLTTSGTATASCAGNLTVNGTGSIGAGSTFNGGSGTLDFNSSLTAAGTGFTATSGTMYVAGDFNNSSGSFTHSSGTIELDGTDATMTTGSATYNNITLNKELYLQITGPLTLAGQLNLTYGFLIQDTNNNLQAGSIQIGYNGNLRNWGTGSLTVGGTVNNDGRVDFNGGNDSVCGSATKIQIRSTENGTQRSWTSSGGTGRFFMVDVDVKDQGGSAAIVCYGSANNGNVGANWTINGGCVGAPTAIRLVSFAAAAGEGGVELAWQTGFEVDNLGFRIYREDASGRATVTPSIVAGSALFAGRGTELSVGRSYRFWDEAGRAGARYFLEDLDLSGKRTLHGPVAVVGVVGRVRGGSPRSPNAEQQDGLMPPALGERGLPGTGDRSAGYLSEVGRTVGRNSGLAPVFGPPLMPDGTSAPKTGACPWNSVPCAPPAGEIPGTGSYFRSDVSSGQNATTENSSQSRISPDEQVVQWELAARKAVKIGVRRAGWYRITQPQLLSAGLDALLDPRRLQLYADGIEQTIQLRGESDGRLDPSDTLEFFGTGLDTRWTDTRVYWLVEGSTQGKRIANIAVSGPPDTSASFSHTLEMRPRTVYFAALRNGEADNFFGPVVTKDPLSEVITLPNLDPAGSGALEIRLQGATDQIHSVRIELNGTDLARKLQFSGQAGYTLQLPLTPGQLREGDNVVRLTALGGEEDVSLVDTLRVTYAHRFTADAPAQFLSLPGGRSCTLAGFPSSAIRVLDIGTPEQVREVAAASAPQGAGYAATFTVPGTGTTTLLVFADTGILTPAFVRADSASNWNQPAAGSDVVMVAPATLLPALAPLKAAQEKEGWTVATVDLEDLYDEFAYGIKTPYAIRAMLQRAHAVWQRAPRFLLLAGDASYDPHDYLGTGTPDLLPTMMVDSGYLETASDDWFADLDGASFPQLAVGRLPARSVAEAETLVGKALAYRQAGRQAAWAQALFLAADTPDTFDFEAATRKVKAAASGGSFQVQELYRAAAGDAAARRTLLEALNAGKLVVNYLGHSSVDEWRGKLLTAADAVGLTNGSRLPLFLVMGCLSNYFVDVEGDSLGEALLRAPRGGAVGVWASSGLALPERQLEVNLEVYKYLLNGGTTVGEALLRAKVTAGDAEIVRTWVYLGDPTLQLVPLEPGSRCDVNGDGRIDIADLQLLIYVILGQAPCPGSCDFNRDLKVDMLDFLLLSGSVLGKSPC